MLVIQQAIDFLNANMGMTGMIALVVEMILRLVKSEQPKSLLYGLAAIIRKTADLLSKAAEFLDKILPQRLKVEEPKK